MQKMNPMIAGLSQALGVIIYTIIVGNVLLGVEKLNIQMPNAIGIALFLTLLVFSAAVCGALVFGYPVYLLVKGNVKDCLKVLASTFISILILGILVMVIISLF